jgi:hypothetical protein
MIGGRRMLVVVALAVAAGPLATTDAAWSAVNLQELIRNQEHRDAYLRVLKASAKNYSFS